MDEYYSVIIPFHGKRESLEMALSSLESTNYSKKEMILINDGSGYDLSSIAEKFRCKLINIPERRGPSFARNRGAEVAHFENLVFLDSDIIVPKNCFVKINNFLHHNPSISVVNCWVSSNSPYSNFFSRYLNLLYKHSILKGGEKTIYTSFCAVKTDWFNKVGGFDESVPRQYADDMILGWKLYDQAAKFALLKEVEVEHCKKVTFIPSVLYWFFHGYYWGKYSVIYRKRLKTQKLFHRKEGILTVVALFLLLFINYFGRYNLFLNVLIFLCLFIGINFNFLKFVGRETNILFAFKSIWIIIFQHLVYLFSGISGILNGLLTGRRL